MSAVVSDEGHMSSRDESFNGMSEMALPTAATLVSVLGTLLGLCGHSVLGAGAAAAGHGVGFVNAILDRRARRKRQRLDGVVRDLLDRVADIEGDAYSGKRYGPVS